MAKHITVHEVTDKVPSDAICKRFDVKERSIRLARERGVFPASWYRGIKELCEAHGVGFSDDLFNWKSPSDGDNTATAIKRGDASGDLQAPDRKKVNADRGAA